MSHKAKVRRTKKGKQVHSPQRTVVAQSDVRAYVVGTAATAIGLIAVVVPVGWKFRLVIWFTVFALFSSTPWLFHWSWLTSRRRTVGTLAILATLSAFAWWTWPETIQIYPKGGFVIATSGAKTTADVTVVNKGSNPVAGVIVEIWTEPPSNFEDGLIVDVASDPNAIHEQVGSLDWDTDVVILEVAPPKKGVQLVIRQIDPGQIKHIHVSGTMKVPTQAFARLVNFREVS